MKSFKKFISEFYNVPVVTVDKTEVDLNEPATVNEINKNLSIALSKDFSNPREGIHAAEKILTMYGIELSRLDDEDTSKKKGKISVPISQFRSSGENHKNVTPPFGEKNAHHTFTLTFELKDGVYDIHAEVTEK